MRVVSPDPATLTPTLSRQRERGQRRVAVTDYGFCSTVSRSAIPVGVATISISAERIQFS